jgi:hypothetical protein
VTEEAVMRPGGACLRLLLAAAVLAALMGFGRAALASESLSLFDRAWSDFHRHYSYFEVKDVDWVELRREHRPRFTGDLTPLEFASRLSEMLQELEDHHVTVRGPAGGVYRYEGIYRINYPVDIPLAYARRSEYATLGRGAIRHAELKGGAAHLIIDSLDSELFDKISERALDRVMERYRNSPGVIVDIRANQGGSRKAALRLASRFADRQVTVAKVRERIPDGGYSGLKRVAMAPSGRTRYTGQVVCLVGEKTMSAAEWLAMALDALPRVTLMGDVTRGSSGLPRTFSLENGVTYRIPTQVVYRPDGKLLEGRGVEPDIRVSPEKSIFEGRDVLLEAAAVKLSGVAVAELAPGPSQAHVRATIPRGTGAYRSGSFTAGLSGAFRIWRKSSF